MEERSRAGGGAGPRRRRAKDPLGDALEPALELAYAQIASRPRSAAEIRRRLVRAGSTAPVIDRVIERLHELRYLDDAAFARSRAGSLARRGFGPQAIASKLAQAGVRGETARDGLREAVAGDEPALARDALEKRLRGRRFAELDPKERLKLQRWLAGRGFSSGAIRSACGAAAAADDQPV